MLLFALTACRFPAFVPATTDSDPPTETGTDTDDTDDTDVDPPTPVPLTLPSISIGLGQVVQGGSLAAPLDTLGDGRFVLTPITPPAVSNPFDVPIFDGSRTLQDTWQLDLTGGPDTPFVSPVGEAMVPGLGQRFVFAVSGSPSGAGQIHYFDGTHAQVLYAPADDLDEFGRTALVLPEGVLVASASDDGSLYLHPDPVGPPTKSWAWPQNGAKKTGRYLAAAQLDDDPASEFLAGTGGVDDCTLDRNDCDSAAIWGLELPAILGDPMSLGSARVKFSFRTDGGAVDVGTASAVMLDADRDGCDDLIVAAPWDGGGDRGQLHFVPCLTDRIAISNEITSNDGYVAFQGPPGQRLGSSMVVLDGFLTPGEPAIAVAAWRDTLYGNVYVFRPHDFEAGAAIDVTQHQDRWLEIGRGDSGVEALGTTLANVGDLDGDGRDDLAIGSLGQGVVEQVYLMQTTLIAPLWEP